MSSVNPKRRFKDDPADAPGPDVGTPPSRGPATWTEGSGRDAWHDDWDEDSAAEGDDSAEPSMSSGPQDQARGAELPGRTRKAIGPESRSRGAGVRDRGDALDAAPEAETSDELEALEDPEDAGRDDPGGKSSRKRSKTIARKQMLRERRRMIAQGTIPEIVDYERPVHRSECRDEKRPCLYVSCRYHLYLDVNPVTGSIKLNFPDKEVWEIGETCALDVAERGGITLEEVGEIMNLTRERIRQVEVSGLEKLKHGEVKLHTFIDGRELESLRPTRLPVLKD